MSLALATLAGCASPPPPKAPAVTECKVLNRPAIASDAERLADLRSKAENGVLYTLLGTTPLTPGAPTCTARHESGAVMIDYRFANGAQLHVERNFLIEQFATEARLAEPSVGNPVLVLADVEHEVFDVVGCGIAWSKPQGEGARDEPGATEAVFRGDVCNCQARVRLDPAGRILRMAFRSAC